MYVDTKLPSVHKSAGCCCENIESVVFVVCVRPQDLGHVPGPGGCEQQSRSLASRPLSLPRLRTLGLASSGAEVLARVSKYNDIWLALT